MNPHVATVLSELTPTENPALRPPPLPLEAIFAEPAPAAAESHVAQIAVLARILLGAAHADGFYAVAEAVAIAGILARFVDLEPLPAPVRDALRDFDPATFDLEGACAALTVATPQDRRELLDLVSRVVDADHVVEAREGSYLYRVARAIGAADAEVAEFVAGVRPPPLPAPPGARQAEASAGERFDEANPWRADDDAS